MADLQSISKPERRIAMLIDGDNAQYSLLKQMIEETSRYGEVTIRRSYGDWTQPNLSNWRSVMLAHAIQPIQQWRYTTGKNATDSALIIDAMDILYSGTVQGFCIVSSDSDYTRLCTRIREAGLFVMGIGRKNTPEAFINACNKFVLVENLPQSETPKPAAKRPNAETAKPKAGAKTAAEAKATVSDSQKALLQLLRRAIDISAQDDDGWVHLGALGNSLQRIEPSFDSRTYGFKNLSLLIQSIPKQMEMKGAKKSGSSVIYVRMKDG